MLLYLGEMAFTKRRNNFYYHINDGKYTKKMSIKHPTIKHLVNDIRKHRTHTNQLEKIPKILHTLAKIS